MRSTGESYAAARSQLARRARARVASDPVVVVPVRDMARAVNFYSAGLGLAVRSRSDTWTILGDDGELVALEPGGTTGRDLGLGLKVPDLDAALRSVAAAGGAVDSRNGPSARVTDPDGNVLRLLAVAGAA